MKWGRGERRNCLLMGKFLADLADRGDRTRTCNPRFWRPVLCQLSYAPRFEGTSVSGASTVIPMRSPSQRGALGLLFLLLGLGFGGLAYAAAVGSQWVIVGAALVLAFWLEGLAVRAFRR
jgi:fatty acid desaturase